MSGELKGEWKLLKVWECHRCKTLIRSGRNISDHKCDIKEDELSVVNRTIEEQKNIIEEQKKAIEEQKNIIDSQKGGIEDRDKFIDNQKNVINGNKNTIKDQKRTIEEQNKGIEYYKKTIENQNAVIEEQNKVIKDKAAEDHYKIIEDQKTTIENYRRTIENQKISMDDKDRIANDQKKIIEDQKRIIRDQEIKEKTTKKNISNINNKDNGGICVHVWEEGKYIKDSKNIGYREDIEIDVFAKGRGRDRIIIKNGRLIKKPDDIEIIGEQTPDGFIMKGIYKN